MNAAPARVRATHGPRPPRLPHGRPLTYAPPGYQVRLRATLRRIADASGRGWQAVVAARLGVSNSTVCLLVAGERMPSITVLVRVSEASGVNLHWMLTGLGPIAAPEPTAGATRNAGAVP